MGDSAVKVSHWTCFREFHQDAGFHYHCSVEITGNKKWISVKSRLTEIHNIVVNFSDKHNFYISAYRYFCKQDNNVAHSQGHPNLAEAKSPRTKKPIECNRAASKKRRFSSACSVNTAPKKKRLANSELSDFIKEHNIKNYLELLAIAQIRKEEGETDIHEYVLSHQEKYAKELIKKTWDIVQAPENLKQLNLTRMEELVAAAKTNCITGCNKPWLECALELLRLNNIDFSGFSDALYNNLRYGRGKFHNVILVGPTNAGETFMFKPLKQIFGKKLSENPFNDKSGWVGADKASVILLQDYRWAKEPIPWKDMLLILEGETLNYLPPKIFSLKT